MVIDTISIINKKNRDENMANDSKFDQEKYEEAKIKKVEDAKKEFEYERKDEL